MNVNVTFNMGDLAPYMEDDFEDLRENSSQEGQVNAYSTPS